ncbi:MAG: PEP-CTERM sorting domain-containing protein [Verrucomicrobia bacterium]|nr:PEP-CTERM sorting domain-containing protein [Verrucomicrobiota bacterium]
MKLLRLAVATLTLTGLSALHAQTYTTTTNNLYSVDFNTMDAGPIISGTTITNSTNGWVMNVPDVSPYNTVPGPAAINAYPVISQYYGNVLNLGGLDGYSVKTNTANTLPHNQFNYIAHPFTFDQTGGKIITGVQLQSQFAISPSSNQYADSTSSRMDNFGFTLQDTNGNSPISFDLNAYNNSTLSMGYTVSGANSGNGSYTIGTGNQASDFYANTIPENEILFWNYSDINTLQLTFSGLNTDTVSMDVTINGIQLFSSALNADFHGIDLTSIASAAPTWILYDGTSDPDTGVYTGYGNNQMAMLNYSVNQLSVPEPQTWILFGLSGLIMVVAIRRRANS